MEFTHEYICAPGVPPYEVAPRAMDEDFWQGLETDSGIHVTPWRALGNCHVWKALNVLAGDIGQLPIKLFRRGNRGEREEVVDAPEIEVLRTAPTSWLRPSVWKETMMWSAALFGNAYSWVYRPAPGVIQLVPLRSDRMRIVIEDELRGAFYFVYSSPTGAQVPFDFEDIIHIQGLSVNGVYGISLIDIAKQTIGHSLALERTVSSFFSHGMRPSGVLKHKMRLTAEARELIRREWMRSHGGAENAARVAVLAEDMDYMPVSMTLESAQVEALRRLDREFVAELFGLPLYKLNSLERAATRSNLEQQQQEYLQGSLARWLNRFREEFERKILSPAQQRAGYYYRWITEALLRPDTESRYRAYEIAIRNRIMSPNEVREKEDMTPYEGGDEFLNPNIERTRSTEAMNAIVADRLRHVVLAEVGAVRRAARVAHNFVAWLDQYYSQHGEFCRMLDRILLPTLAALQQLDPDFRFDAAGWFARHAKESQALLLEVCGQCTRADLVKHIITTTSSWVDSRIENEGAGNVKKRRDSVDLRRDR